MDMWIKYPENTPSEHVVYWTYNKAGEIRLCRFRKMNVGWGWKKQWVFSNIMSKFGLPDVTVTHFMPAIPDAPTEDNLLDVPLEVYEFIKEMQTTFCDTIPHYRDKVKVLISKLKIV